MGILESKQSCPICPQCVSVPEKECPQCVSIPEKECP